MAKHDLLGMVRNADHDTSVLAAEHQAEKRSELQILVREALRRESRTRVFSDGLKGLTDEELRLLPEFGGLAESTVRKRRTELRQKGDVVAIGKRLNSFNEWMKVWAVVDAPPAPPTVRRLRPVPPVVKKRSHVNER
jgi:hypothetical protein